MVLNSKTQKAHSQKVPKLFEQLLLFFFSKKLNGNVGTHEKSLNVSRGARKTLLLMKQQNHS